MYAIEKNVPPPAEHGAPNRAIYPFREMKVGDSFLVSPDRADKVRTSASSIGQRLGRKFTIRKNEDGSARVWRIA